MPTTVAIIGAGPLGRWLALAAARAGFRVLLEDVMPANLSHAQEFLRQQLSPVQNSESLLRSKGTGFSPDVNMATPASTFPPGGSSQGVPPSNTSSSATTPASVAEVLSKIAFVTTIEDAVRQADLAIDCVPDELESKLEILWLLDRMAPPRTVLATPTTRLSIADLANCTYRPEKCIAIAAEASSLAGNRASEILLRTTSRTAPETVALLKSFWQQLGFTTIFAPDSAEKSQG